MKAVYIKDFGDVENLEIRDVPEPAPPAGTETLIRVHAAGLNRADLLQRRGLYPAPAGTSSNIPGLEFAGEITAVGELVKRFSIGDRVFGIAAGEAQAEYILSDESIISPIPDNLTFDEAAAVPEAFITAHDALFTLGELRSNEGVLIHAVGSGVGLAALQLAKSSKCYVIGTSRTPEKLEKCKELGLDDGISTSDGVKFSDSVISLTGGCGADIILDLVGAAFFEQNLASLALKGRLILVGLTSGRSATFDLGVALHKRLKIVGTALRARSPAEKAEAVRLFERDVLPLLKAGTVRANVDKVFQASDVRDAHTYLESNDSFGKVILAF